MNRWCKWGFHAWYFYAFSPERFCYRCPAVKILENGRYRWIRDKDGKFV